MPRPKKLKPGPEACPACNEPWEPTAKRNLGHTVARFFQCSCGHKQILDERGHELRPGRDLATTIWAQLEPGWRPMLLNELEAYVTFTDAAAILECSTDFVHRLLLARKLSAKFDDGSKLLVSRASLDVYLQSLLTVEDRFKEMRIL